MSLSARAKFACSTSQNVVRSYWAVQLQARKRDVLDLEKLQAQKEDDTLNRKVKKDNKKVMVDDISNGEVQKSQKKQ